MNQLATAFTSTIARLLREDVEARSAQDANIELFGNKNVVLVTLASGRQVRVTVEEV